MSYDIYILKSILVLVPVNYFIKNLHKWNYDRYGKNSESNHRYKLQNATNLLSSKKKETPAFHLTYNIIQKSMQWLEIRGHLYLPTSS